MTENAKYDERELLMRVAAGSKEDFRRLFEYCQPRISYAAHKLLHEKEDVKDVLQEIMSKIWLNRERLSSLDNFSAYLHTLTRNHIYDHFRRKAYEDAYIGQLMTKEDVPASTFNDLQYKELLKKLHAILRTLPARQREVFIMSKLEGMKRHEVAEKLGISAETVKKHLGEALRTVQARLGSLPLLIILMLGK